jgi:aspartyl/asparaginyl beta-hydroxylase (cupin superfamily)
MARIHIPLWTDEKAVFIADGKHLHMPADGSAYMVWVNIWHQIRNDSDIDRYHLIMDAYDTKHITENFKYMGDFPQLENFARGFREQIETVELSEDDKEFFKAIKARYTSKKG